MSFDKCDQISRISKWKWRKHNIINLNTYSILKKSFHIVNTQIPHLTHWGRVTHICVSKLTIIGPDNSLTSGRRQAIIWTNAGILWIWSLGTNFSEILIEKYTFSFKKMHLHMSSGKWRPFCLGLNVIWHYELGHVILTVITRTAISVSYIYVRSLQFFRRWDTRRFYLRVFKWIAEKNVSIIMYQGAALLTLKGLLTKSL